MANKSESKNVPTLTGAEIVWATLVGGAILPAAG
jgi:hypothetical protein